MSDNNFENTALPQAEMPDSTTNAEKEIFIPVKFNKQIINLKLEKAQELAQKGMKFDLISKDFDALKNLALAEGKSVGEYIEAIKASTLTKREGELLEKCGGDKELAQHILSLEKGENNAIKGFAELKEDFPQFECIEDLPESVVEAASLKGTKLLDEYLRYLHRQDMAIKKSIRNQKSANDSAMGSLQNQKGTGNPEAMEFLKGLWQK